MQSQELKNPPRPKLFRFVIAWLVVWALASRLPDILLQPDDVLYSEIHTLLYFTALGALQFFVIRRFLHVELRAWAPLTFAGAIAGVIGFKAFVSSSAFIVGGQFAIVTAFLLLWSTPPIFQWFTLRKRFRNHLIWLLAAVVIAPLSYFLGAGQNSGIFKPALGPLHELTGIASPVLQFLASWADGAIPAAVLSLALYAIVTQGSQADRPASASNYS